MYMATESLLNSVLVCYTITLIRRDKKKKKKQITISVSDLEEIPHLEENGKHSTPRKQ